MNFPGFPPQAISFLRGLKRNNRREWFQARKHVYDGSVKQPMVALISALFENMMDFAPDYVGEPERTIYRIYRDTRFSSDKTPYKTHIAASFARRGLEKHSSAGFYFSVSATEVEVGAGVYMPGPAELLAIRGHLARKHRKFRGLTDAPALRRLMGAVQGEQLTRTPRGFAADHPAQGLLRLKQFLLYRVLDGSLAATPRLAPELLKRFRAMTPFVNFLNEPLLAAKRRPRAAF